MHQTNAQATPQTPAQTSTDSSVLWEAASRSRLNNPHKGHSVAEYITDLEGLLIPEDRKRSGRLTQDERDRIAAAWSRFDGQTTLLCDGIRGASRMIWGSLAGGDWWDEGDAKDALWMLSELADMAGACHFLSSNLDFRLRVDDLEAAQAGEVRHV